MDRRDIAFIVFGVAIACIVGLVVPAYAPGSVNTASTWGLEGSNINITGTWYRNDVAFLTSDGSGTLSSLTISGTDALTLGSNSIEDDVLVYPYQSPSYVVFRSGSTYYAKNGETGAIDYSGNDADAVITNALTAMNLQGTLLIKQGEYLVDTRIDLSGADNLQIIAEKDTWLIQNANTDIFYFDGASYKVLIENIYFNQTNPGTYTGYAINVENPDSGDLLWDSVIKNIGIYYINNSLSINRAYPLTLENVELAYCGNSSGTSPVNFANSHDIYAHQLLIEHSNYRPITVASTCNDVNIENYHIENGSAAEPDYAIFVNGAPRTRIINGVIHGASTYMIYLKSIDGYVGHNRFTTASGGGVIVPSAISSRTATIDDNFMENLGGFAVYGNSEKLTIIDNKIQVCSNDGIRLNYGWYSEVAGNDVFANDGSGIAIIQTQYARIIGNHVDDKDRDGIDSGDQDYGIIEGTGADNNIIIGNVALNHNTADYTVIGSGTIFIEDTGASQLNNITLNDIVISDSLTIGGDTRTSWPSALGLADQGLNTTDNVTFNNINATGKISLSTQLDVETVIDTNYEYSGETATIKAGDNLAAGNFVYINATGYLLKADADAAVSMPCFGMALDTASPGAQCLILIRGWVFNSGWTLAEGDSVYVSTTAGTLTTTAPSGSGDQVQVIGIGLSEDLMYFNPDYTVLEIT